jgi:lactate permease
MVGRQLPFFSVLVPFWLIWAFAGWRGMKEIWPAILVTGVTFAIPQYLISNYHGPWLVDVGAAIVSMACLTLFLQIWKPKSVWTTTALKGHEKDSGTVENAGSMRLASHDRATVIRAWVPWLVLSVFVFAWGTPQVRSFLNGSYTVTRVEQTATGPVKTEEKTTFPWDGVTKLDFKVAGLNEMVEKVPPVVAKAHTEKAVYSLNWLSATGSGILIAAILAGLFMRYSAGELVRKYWETIKLVRFSLLTIAAMLAIGFTTRYSGTDATLGLAFAHTGALYPFFGTMLGWLGVALTGSDTASNVLFGGLQRITSEQLGLNANLMASANSSGGVMGKMIDAQSIVVASTATRWYGHEGDILRYVFFHSIVLAALVGGLVVLQAYVYPFSLLQIWPGGGG